MSDHLKGRLATCQTCECGSGLAREMAKELNEYHGQVFEAARSAGTEELDVARANELLVVNHCQGFNLPYSQRIRGRLTKFRGRP